MLSVANAKIVTITNLDLFQQDIKKIDSSNTLVIFDIDHVLIMPTNEYTRNRHPYRKQLWKEMQLRMPRKELDYLQSIVTRASKWQLVDNLILKIIDYLNKNNISTIILTSRNTGKLGIIPKLEDFTIKNLNNMGIKIPIFSPFNKTIILDNLKDAPIMKNGIISTSGNDKGIILEKILNILNYYPMNILFIDDQIYNIKSVAKTCKKMKINFLGYHYIATSLTPTIIINKEKEKKRFNNLEKKYIWEPVI